MDTLFKRVLLSRSQKVTALVTLDKLETRKRALSDRSSSSMGWVFHTIPPPIF